MGDGAVFLIIAVVLAGVLYLAVRLQESKELVDELFERMERERWERAVPVWSRPVLYDHEANGDFGPSALSELEGRYAWLADHHEGEHHAGPPL